MSTQSITRWLAAGLLVAAGLLWLGFRTERTDPSERPGVAASGDSPSATPPPAAAPGRPRTPPVRGRDAPPVSVEPTVPADAEASRREAYVQAVQEQHPRPGEQAFRAMVSAFIEHNQAFAEAQAQAEKISIDEVHELTVFGLMAQESQRWSEVEELLGGPVDADKRERSEALLRDVDTTFKQEIRELVADGAPVDERWSLIRSTQQEYRERYFEITGMDRDRLDDLLAGDASRSYAPGSTPAPEDVPPSEEQPAPPPVREAQPAARG